MKKPKDILTHVVTLEQAAIKRKLVERVPGSFTAEEYAEKTERSPVTVNPILRKLVNTGKLKRVKVPKLTSDGRVQMVHGYVLSETET